MTRAPVGEVCEGCSRCAGLRRVVPGVGALLLVFRPKVVRMTGSDARQLLVTLIGLGVALILAAGAVFAWTLVPTGAAQRADAQGCDAPVASDKSIGMNSDVGTYGAQARADALAAMESAGYRWLRTRFPWGAIEPEPGRFDWSKWDEVVSGATRHNLELVAVLDGSPPWAREEGEGTNELAPPLENSDFGAFAFAFAERYGDAIDHYQVWDEPNIAPHWGANEINPTAYARLLREGAIQIRAADPGATILAAALAPTVEAGGLNMNEVHFLDALYDAGASEWFDAVAGQPYDFGRPLSSAASPSRLNWDRIELLRDVMVARGDDERAIWAVSFGVEGEARDEGPPGGAEDSIVQAVVRARRSWPWLGPMLWAAWAPEDTHGQYAVTRRGAPLQPAYDAVSTLAQAPVVAWPGVYSADHESGQYDGDWRVTSSGADVGETRDRLRVPFRGTGFDLTVRRGDFRGFLFASIDGDQANALPNDLDGRSYVVLFDPLQQVETVSVARGLSDGAHMAEFVAERGWGQWAIVGWRVVLEEGGAHGWLPIALALGSALALCATLLTAWPRRDTLLVSWRYLLSGARGIDDRVMIVLIAGAAVLLFAAVGTVPSLLAVTLLGGLVGLRPELALPLIALALPFYQLGVPLLGKVFSMTEILIVLASLGWLVQCVSLGPDHRISPRQAVRSLSVLDWGVVAFVLVAGASLIWAQHTRPAAREFRTVVLEAALFYALVRILARDMRHAWRIVDALIIGGCVIALVGVIQAVWGENVIAADGVWRVRGFYGSPNNLALYLGRVVPVALAMAVWGVRGRPRWAYAAATIVMLAGVLLSYSRGAWLLGIPVALLFLAAMRGRRAIAVAVGLLVVGLAIAYLGAGGERVGLLLNTGEGTSFLRLQLWRSSAAMVRDHPILGVGLDNFLYLYRTQYVLPTAWQEFNLSHPHNIILDFWLRLGVAGVLVLGWLLVGFFRLGSQAVARMRSTSEPAAVMSVGLMASVVYTLAHGLVDNAFFLVDLGFCFMLALALIQVGVRHGPHGGRALSSSVVRAEGGNGCGF